LYLSEIASNHTGYFAPAYRDMLLRIKQRGNQITAFDSTYQLKVEGVVEQNRIRFYAHPSPATWGNGVSGKWAIQTDGNFNGSWSSDSHMADGSWNLRKLHDSGVEFYTTDKGMDSPTSLAEADALFERIFSREEDRNIVFFLHGRGANFDDLFGADGVPAIEAYSETRFVIMRWLSWADISIRPYNHAIGSADGVAEFLYAFDRYKSRIGNKIGNRKITLMAHSMGSIPLAAFLQQRYEQGGLQSGLFDSIIFNSADIPFANHRRWLEKCDFSKQIYVTQHSRDYILKLSRIFFSPEDETDSIKLGIGLDPEDASRYDQLAGNANYLDLTNLTFASHKHFSSESTLPLFKALLNARKVDYPDPSIGLYRKSTQHPVFFFYSSEPEQAEHQPDSS
jgi:esterase/lipase superfamily enzyme